MDAEELETDPESWKLGRFPPRSDWYIKYAVVSAKLREIGGVYCAEVLSRAEEVYVLVVATALSPSSPIIIVIQFDFVQKTFLKHMFYTLRFSDTTSNFRNISVYCFQTKLCIYGQVCLHSVFDKCKCSGSLACNQECSWR